MAELILTVLGVTGGVVVTFLLMRRAGAAAPETFSSVAIAERIRAVGRLVGLDVNAKEIATTTKGWSWMPPLLLSQARVAMIFHFEKQYSVDLARLRPDDVREIAPGHFRITLPPIEGSLRLTDLEPYDIQAGRVLGLLDIIQVNAATQKELMRRAQDQAASLFTNNDARYQSEARASVQRHLKALLSLFDITVDIEWADQQAGGAPLPGVPNRLEAPARL